MQQPKQVQKWERVHVFISSTFNDMHAERDYLVKKVFPELQEWCERRKLRLVDIDLRWGVTEQDATHNRNAVKACLERIDDCRPFFICFLGQRRGWVPGKSEVSAETYDRFPELSSHVGDMSVTELEILHAVINPLHRNATNDSTNLGLKYEKAKHAFSYLRDESYLDDIPLDPPLLREIYTNEGVEDPGERVRHDLELNKLRSSLENVGHPCRHYAAFWNENAMTPEIMLPLSSPSFDPQNINRWRKQWAKIGIDIEDGDIKVDDRQLENATELNIMLSKGRLTGFSCDGRELKDVILEDLKEAITARYPDHLENAQESKLQKELDQQEEFLHINTEGFIEREGDFSELDCYLFDDSRQIFILTAQGGMGKTTLLANWIDRRKDQPEGDYTLHFRFVGQSDHSATLTDLLRFLILELQEIAKRIPSASEIDEIEEEQSTLLQKLWGIPPADEIPLDPVGVRELWRKQLASMGKNGRIVFVIDAIDQLDTGLKDLSWLPMQGLPKRVKLIVSFRDDVEEAKEMLERVKANTEHIRLVRTRPFHVLEDRRRLVDIYLNQYLKQIDARHLEEIITLNGAENPLYLKVVLSELRVFGSFDNLAAKIKSDFGDSPITAFDGTLRRLENDPAYSTILPGDAVPLLFGLVAHSRNGLSAKELSEMFVQGLGLPQTIEQQTIALESTHHILRQVRPFFARRDGRFDFFFDNFKRAALDRYVKLNSADSIHKRTTAGWHALIASYFSGLPLWESRDEFKPTTRKVAELPYHQTCGAMWSMLTETLTDLRFLEAKCAAGMSYELVADYNHAIDVLPEVQDLKRLDGEKAERMKCYVREMVEYAKSWNDARAKYATNPKKHPMPKSEDIPLPEIISTAGLWMHEEYDIDGQRTVQGHTDPDRVKDFASFVAAESHSLFEFGNRDGFALQQAWNKAPAGPVHEAAEGLLPSCKSPLLLRRWRDDAIYNPNPPLVSTLQGNRFPVLALSMTPDGRKALSASGFEKALRVWDLETGQCVRFLEKPLFPPAFRAVQMTPDGRRAVSADGDCILRVWDVGTGWCIRELESDELHAVFLTPDGRRAVSGSNNGTIAVWDLEEGRGIRIMEGHAETVNAVHMTPDGRRAISGSKDNTLRFWDLDTGDCIRVLKGHRRSVEAVSLTPDGRRAISGSEDKTARVWDLEAGRSIRVLEGHSDSIRTVCMTPDGRKAVSGSKDSTVRVWNLETWRCIKSLEGHSFGVSAVSMTSDGCRALSGGGDNTIHVWDLETGCCLRAPEGHRSTVSAVDIIPESGTALSGSRDKTIRVWDVRTGHCIRTLEGHNDGVRAVSATADGRKAVSGGSDKRLRIWDLGSGCCIRTMEAHHQVKAVSAAPDGRVAVSASSDGRLRVWDLETGRCIRIIDGTISHIFGVRVAPDGRRAISCGDREELEVWDLETGGSIQTLEGNSYMVLDMCITPDGRKVVLAHYDKSLRVWDLKTGRSQILEGHSATVAAVSVTPDGLAAVSGSLDHTIRLWDLETGHCLAVFPHTSCLASSLSVGGKEGLIVVGTESGEVVFLSIRNIAAGPALLTASYYKKPLEQYLAQCPVCGCSFQTPGNIIQIIQSFSGYPTDARDRQLAWPVEAFETPTLLSACPRCHHALRFNPFYVDMTDERYERFLRRSLDYSRPEKATGDEELLSRFEVLLAHLERTRKTDEVHELVRRRDELVRQIAIRKATK